MPAVADITDTILKDLIGEDFPDDVVIIAVGELHMCFKYGELHGLSVFSTEERAGAWMEFLPDISRFSYEMVPFETARQIAKEKQNLSCLLLMDNPLAPKVHYVR